MRETLVQSLGQEDQETLVQSPGQEDPLEKGQDTHFSILGLPCGSVGKNPPAMQETWILSLS